MSTSLQYDYEKHRQSLMNPSGIALLLEVVHKAKILHRSAGAFSEIKLLEDVAGDSWDQLAVVDLLRELKHLVVVHHASHRSNNILIYTGP